ncbi:MAG: hypothetical protein QMC93_03470 [Patescibacteria group bacterium]|nr:hypothetical protein [Patescibacteria group bacterium]
MNKIVIITLILTILVICFPYILSFSERIYLYTFELGWLRGEKTKEELVAKYLEGLRVGNSQIIERLLPKTHEASKEIREKIERFKESDFSKIKISFETDGHLDWVKIKNIRLKSGEITSDEIWIKADCHQYPGIECKKWYLVMGIAKGRFRPIPLGMELERK